jgi:hypothetical protein
MVITAAGRTSNMLLVGDRVNMQYEGRRVYGTVAVIHETPTGDMTYWIDGDDGENCLLFDDTDLKIINADYAVDFS